MIRNSHSYATKNCEVCALLKQFQTQLIETVSVPDVSTLCNYHAWALARSANAANVSSIFLKLLVEKQPNRLGKNSSGCDICTKIQEEEEFRLKTFGEQMNTPKSSDWMFQHGGLCLSHGGMLSKKVSKAAQRMIREDLENNAAELIRALRALAQEERSSGGGALGRAAEFLFAQRGLR